MYYKITNKESKIYKDLYKMRMSEIEKDKENKELVKQKVELEFEKFLGSLGQQNFLRTTQYSGFLFKEPNKVNPKIWKRHKEYPEAFVPNKRTKEGKEMHEFLNSGLESGNLFDLLDILKLKVYGKFSCPYLHITKNDELILWLSDDFDDLGLDENIIEITSKEFHSLNK